MCVCMRMCGCVKQRERSVTQSCVKRIFCSHACMHSKVNVCIMKQTNTDLQTCAFCARHVWLFLFHIQKEGAYDLTCNWGPVCGYLAAKSCQCKYGDFSSTRR